MALSDMRRENGKPSKNQFGKRKYSLHSGFMEKRLWPYSKGGGFASVGEEIQQNEFSKGRWPFMSPNEMDREFMISFCMLKSGYSEEYFEKLSDEDLAAEYQRHLGEGY